ncbi:hypothetical protein BCD67_05045 [Oscillatoriales cyanobacterium USR001]|nr:hypothetical protein BCD67_05045 [Oscillatoriales cyanobacterium USR001]
MEELLELKELLGKGDIKGSLAIVEELEDMSKSDIINNIISYAVILLLHLIKQAVENRYEARELDKMVNREEAIERALVLILPPE